jgi:phosphocarrier protein
MSRHSHEVTIVNKRGLHARASAKFVAAAAGMDGNRVVVAKDGHEALGTSILGLMMLGAAKGDTVILRVEGSEAEARLAELVALIETGFGED